MDWNYLFVLGVASFALLCALVALYYLPPVRSQPRLLSEAERLRRLADGAEKEMQTIFFDGYAKMIEELRQAQVDRFLDGKELS